MTHHKCHIATARIGYRGRADERVLDTTVKSGTELGAVFAPTWKLVMGVKRGDLTWSAYVEVMWNMSRCQEGSIENRT
jgi:hypothetical protein